MRTKRASGFRRVFFQRSRWAVSPVSFPTGEWCSEGDHTSRDVQQVGEAVPLPIPPRNGFPQPRSFFHPTGHGGTRNPRSVRVRPRKRLAFLRGMQELLAAKLTDRRGELGSRGFAVRRHGSERAVCALWACPSRTRASRLKVECREG